jgi:hypothetical protein
MSEKAITIGLYAVASGIFTAFLPSPRVAGSRVVRKYLEEDIERETGGRFLFTNDIEEAARGIVAHLDSKRKALNLAPMLYQDGLRIDGVAARSLNTYIPPAGLASLGCGKAQEHSHARPPEE